jgi:hypothetical protein
MSILYEMFPILEVQEEVCMPLCVGTSLAIIIPTSIRSFNAHRIKGAVDMRGRCAIVRDVPIRPFLRPPPPKLATGAFLGSAACWEGKSLRRTQPGRKGSSPSGTFRK